MKNYLFSNALVEPRSRVTAADGDEGNNTAAIVWAEDQRQDSIGCG